jgi:hypothetical protein
MTGSITLIGAGELMSTMSSQHRAVLSRLSGTPRPVFLDTTAGFETNIDTIVAKAVEYYAHHLQTELRVARYRHRDRTSAAELAAAIAEIRAANLIFAGPGSPTYAIKQWRETPIWDAIVERFEAGGDVLFASAASITLGRHALPVYEVYKAGNDPYWEDGLDLLGRFGLNLAVVPHYNDSSGGENYDSRFCYMGARRFDALQECLPPDVTILGIDAYTCVCFDPATRQATVSGQGTITLIGDGEERRYHSGEVVPFEAFQSSSRGVVRTDDGRVFGGYEFSDDGDDAGKEDEAESEDILAPLLGYVEALSSMRPEERLELMTRLQGLREGIATARPETDGPLVELILELREALRQQKRFDLADKARQRLDELGYEIGDSKEGSTWTRR